MKKLATMVMVSAALSSLGGLGCGDSGGTGGSGAGGNAASGTVDVVIGGEDAAQTGFPYDPSADPHFADGWALHFDHVLVVVDEITLSQNPDLAPSDQSQTGKLVAQLDGPFAVDLHKKGPLPGEGGEGEGTAGRLGGFENQNKNGGAAFEADQRYALRYRTVAASAGATKVNFEGDAETEALYDEMVANHWNVLYVGSATFDATASDCQSSDSGAYDFSVIPKTVKFKLGFTTPVHAINCDNELNQGDAFPGEEFQRGVPIVANKASTAQLMFHLDHPWFTDVVHDAPLYFDPFAAQAAGKPSGTLITLDDLVGLDPTAFVDGEGAKLPWRVCDGTQVPPTTQRGYGVGNIAVNPSGDPSKGFRDYRDYTSYVQSTQEHLNGGEGLCYIARDYPSPK